MRKKYIPAFALFVAVIVRSLSYFGTHRAVQASLDEPAIFVAFGKYVTGKVQSSLPRITADLLLGMTIGIDSVKQDTRFYEALITTGLVHVVVVSGYNVTLVTNATNRFYREKFCLRNKVLLALVLTLYVIVCGLQAPVIRAALMGYTVYLARSYGRGLDGLLLLAVICLLMLFVCPYFLVSLSFWLSTMATLGLMLFGTSVSSWFSAHFKRLGLVGKFIPVSDLATSLACQITVWPIISLFFGRLSILSPIYNMFVLWLIPLCTVVGFIYLVLVLTCMPLAAAFSIIVNLVFGLFIRGVTFFAEIDRGNVLFKIGTSFLIVYYVVLFSIIFLRSKK